MIVLEDIKTLSGVADNEEMIMTKEIEKTLDSIYRKSNSIKRGVEIQNEKDGMIYILSYLKDTITLYRPYLLDFSNLLEDNNSTNTTLIELIDKIVAKIKFGISLLQGNLDFEVFQNNLDSIENDTNKLNNIATNFNESILKFNIDLSNEFATFPVCNGSNVIANIVKELSQLNEEWAEMEEFAC